MAPLCKAEQGAPSRARFAVAAWLAVLAPFVAVFALCLHWEPILRDSWGNFLWFRSNGNIDGEALWGNLWGAYNAGNPRLGQFATFLLFSSETASILATTAMAAASFACLFALALGRWPSWRRVDDAWLFAAVVAMALVAVPQVGPMYFYRPFVGNYVYGFFLHLVLYLPYRFFAARPGPRPWWWAPALLVWGFAAGLTNEHTGPASGLLLALAIVWFRCRGERWAAWMFAGLLGLTLGYLALYFAPGQSIRYNGLAGQQSVVERILSRSGHDSFRIAYIFLLALVGVAPWLLVAAGSALRGRWRLSTLELGLSVAAAVTGALMVVTLFGSPKSGPRLYYAPAAMLVVAVLIWLPRAMARPLARRLLLGVTLAASLYAYGSLLLTYATVGREFRERMALLDRSRGAAVEVPRYSRPQSRWFLGDDFRAPALCAWIAHELGIPALTLAPAPGGGSRAGAAAAPSADD